MIEREGRATGKVILLGEHFAVHGGAAIALPVTSRSIVVRVSAGAGAIVDARGGPTTIVGDAVRAMLTELGVGRDTIDIVIDGDLPLAAGLGGSAALAAALCRALGVANDELRATVHRLEHLAHGRPSGVDGAVVCDARPIWFEGGAVSALAIDRSWDHAFWLAVVPREGSTREAVAKVGAFRAAAPAAFAVAAAEAHADAFALRALLGSARTEDAAGSVGRLFDRAHARLATLGVVNSALSALVAAAQDAGAHGAKLTGAGLGGALVAIAPPDRDLTAAFVAAGATDVIAPTERMTPDLVARPR